LEITKTVLSLILVVMITILTTLTLTTTIAAVYAGGDDDDGDGDGNKQKAEDDSAAAIADCDDNDVEEARFLCIAIATNDVEIEPPEEESATLSVCKEVRTGGFSPDEFTFTVTGNDPSPAQFQGDNADGCVDVTIGPGEYAVSEVGPVPNIARSIEGECVQDPNNALGAIGEIQAGETQECRFINVLVD
jgi:hypothetical protein